MFYRKYSDFDTFFNSVTPEILYDPKLLDFYAGRVGYVKDMVIEIDNTYCNLQLADMGYRIGKWTSLISRYINYVDWCEFKEKLYTVKGHSYTFYFNQNKDHKNGSCLNCIVLSREDSHGKWTNFHVEYRVAELQRRLMADLILFSKLIEDIPKDICDIKHVTLYLPVAYISSMFINAFWEYFGLDLDKLDTSNKFIYGLVDSKKKYFSHDSPPYEKFMSIYRLQKVFKKEITFEEIDNSKLTIDLKQCNIDFTKNEIKKKDLW